MNARETVLSRIRQALPVAVPLPEIQGDWVSWSDPYQQLQQVLEMIGGRYFRVANLAAAQRVLEELPAFQGARERVSAVAGLGAATRELSAALDPHSLSDVDFAVLPGQFVVAENAAVWVDDRDVQPRASFFISQHLALVVPAQELVPHLHAAYARLQFDEPRFGAFIAGPSKTADIEQSLVIGAHGPKSMALILVDNWT